MAGGVNWQPGLPPGVPYSSSGAGMGYGVAQQSAPPGDTAPAGYTWDPVKKGYVPTVGSAQQAAEGLKRAQGFQDTAAQQEKELFARMSQSSGAGMNIPQMPQMPQFTSMPLGSGTSIPAPVQIQYPDLAPAQEAAFGRAKDQQGKITRSALSGLQSQLAGRGMLGSGQEGKGTREIVQQGAETLGNLTREQAIQQVDQAQKAAETAYTGGITQRGQDIGAQESARNAALNQWQAQNQSQLQGYGAQLEGWKAGLSAEQMKQKQLQDAMSGLIGLTKSVY